MYEGNGRVQVCMQTLNCLHQLLLLSLDCRWIERKLFVVVLGFLGFSSSANLFVGWWLPAVCWSRRHMGWVDDVLDEWMVLCVAVGTETSEQTDTISSGYQGCLNAQLYHWSSEQVGDKLQSADLSVCLAAHPPVHPSVCISVHPSVCTSVCLSVCLPAHPLIYPSACLFTFLFISRCEFACLFVCLCLSLSPTM